MPITRTVLREFEADLVVEHAEPVAADVVAMTLRRADGGDLPGWTPGAHIDLVLPDGLVRQYSLCGRTQDAGAYRIAVLKAPDSRGGSTAVHALEIGQSVGVRGPRNHFPIVPARSYLLVAGGIGITPLLAMIHQIEAVGAQWELWYGGRTRSSMAFLDELAPFGDRVHIVPEDTDGRPDLPAILKEPRPGTLVYACGPEGMLAAMEAACAYWPPGSLHLERFSAKQQDEAATGRSFELVLQRSGLTLDVPADQSIFDTVRQAGVSVLGSCLEGICGTCETEVIEVVDGEIEHRDSVLDDEERASNEVMMICVSRCSGARLTLDL